MNASITDTTLSFTNPPSERTTILVAPDTTLREGEWVIALIILAALGILIVIGFEIYLLYKMSGNAFKSMWLGQMLLLGIFLSFFSLFAFAPTTTKATCGIIRFSIGFCYAIIYSVFLVKLMILVSSKTIGYLKGIFQILMFVFALGVQLAIDIEWLILRPPEALLTKSEEGKGIYVCSHSFTSHVTTLSYIMFLILICTILSLKSIRIVTNHRESVYIAACSLLSILIFVVWILLGSLMENKDFEEPCMAFGLLVTAFMVLFVIFCPKIHLLRTMKGDERFLEDDHLQYGNGKMSGGMIHHISSIEEPHHMMHYSPPSYKSNSVSPPVVLVDDVDNAIYSQTYTKPHDLERDQSPESLYLKHPGSTRYLVPSNHGDSLHSYTNTRAVSDIYATNPRVTRLSGDLRPAGTLSEVNAPTSSLRVYQPGHGTARSVISNRSNRSATGTLTRARSLQDLGPL